MQQASGAYQKERVVSYIGSIGAGPRQQKKRRYEQEPDAKNYFGTTGMEHAIRENDVLGMYGHLL